MKVRFKGLRTPEPEQQRGFKVSYGPGKRQAFRWRWYLMLALVLSPVIYFTWQLTADRVLVEADGILTTEPISLAATNSGVVSAILVEPGDRVQPDQVLLDLNSPVISARLEVLTTNRDQLKVFQEGLVSDVRSILDGYEQVLSQENRQLEEFALKFDTLKQKGLLQNSSDLQLQRDRRSVFTEVKNLELDRQRAETILYSNDIANEIRNLEISIAETRAQQAQLVIRAPGAGVVNRVLALPGEFVDIGEHVFEISNFSEPVINVYLLPQRMAHAVVGSSVTIKFSDGRRFEGVVKAPVQVTDTIPASLSGPFQGSKRAIKVVVGFRTVPDRWIEGLPVRVSFPVLPAGESAGQGVAAETRP
jgi:multidrug resistance efflux pump